MCFVPIANLMFKTCFEVSEVRYIDIINEVLFTTPFGFACYHIILTSRFKFSIKSHWTTNDWRGFISCSWKVCYVAVCNNYAICNKLQTALNCNAVCNTLQTAFRILKNAEKRKWNKCSNKTQFEIKFHNKDFSLFLLFYFCIGISLYMIEI